MCIHPKDYQLWTARSRLARIALAALLVVLLPNVLIEPAAAAKRIQSAVALTPESIEKARWSPNFAASKLSPLVFKAQVWLDRAKGGLADAVWTSMGAVLGGPSRPAGPR